MKPTIIFAVIGCLLFLQCGKQTINRSNAISDTFSDSVIMFLQSKIDKEEFSRLDINNSEKLIYNQNTVGIKINETGRNNKRFIMLFKEGIHFAGNWVDVSGLRLNNAGKNEGVFLVEYFDNRPVEQYAVQNNKVIRKTGLERVESANSGHSSDPVENAHNQRISGFEVLPEFVLVGYVDNKAVDFFSMYWLFGQSSSYSYFYTDSPNRSGGGGDNGKGSGSSSSGIAIAPVVIPPDHPIEDIKDELKCFTIDSNSTYSISVNVNQPIPNSRALSDPGAVFKVGHTFMTLEQKLPNGKAIIRNIGFYPKRHAKPGNSIDGGIFGEDSNTPYDISLKMSVSGIEFNEIKSSLISQQDLDYDLYNFNCSTLAISTLHLNNIHLPSTISQAPLFKGNNPADLGEDIRNLNLNNFSIENRNRKVIRTVSKDNTQIPPRKEGKC